MIFCISLMFLDAHDVDYSARKDKIFTLSTNLFPKPGFLFLFGFVDIKVYSTLVGSLFC